jgi:hypothetical protein
MPAASHPQGGTATVPAQSPAHHAPPDADEECETDDFHERTDQRMRYAAMEHQEVSSRARKTDEELAPIRRVCRHDAD